MKYVKSGLLVALLVLLASHGANAADVNWLSFRGEGGRGDASTANPPIEFDVTSGKNVAWKQATTGRGIGGPVIINDLVIVTGNDGEDQRDIHVEAFDREAGKRRWLRSFRSTGRPYTHPTSANASPTPVSDGERVYALFSSCDLICLNLDGSLAWMRGLALDHPKAGNDISMSSSPALVDGVLCVQLENQGDSFAMGIDSLTGKTLWTVERNRRANWTTPQPIKLGDGTSAFVMQDSDSIEMLNAKTGEQMHSFTAKCDTTASCTYAPPYILVPGDETTALKLDATGVEIAWQNNRLRPQRCSPVVLKDRIYMGRGSVLVAGNLEDGEVVWQQRLPEISEVWASPLITANGIFVFDSHGKVVVVEDNGESAEVVAQPVIGESILATPAAVGDSLYLRTDNSVIRVAKSS